MRRNGFSLLELLVVIGIMGLLGTASISAYRSVVKGMEERGALQNANQFVHAAFQRAMIDRLPTAVYFWNETLRSSTADDNEVVVGKAVAVRRGGRITKIEGDKYLYDEFADLNKSYSTNVTGRGSGMYLYQLDAQSDGLQRSHVHDTVHKGASVEIYLLDPEDGSDEDWSSLRMTPPNDGGVIDMYGFEIEDDNGVEWAVGDAYGFEFQSFELPKNYIFGTQYSTDTSSPVTEAGSMVFGYGAGGYSSMSGNATGVKTIQISALRPNTTGNLAPVSIGTTTDPTKE